MEFRLLGPLEVFDDAGNERPLVRRKVQIFLGLLLVRRNHSVDTVTIAEHLWGQHWPKSAMANLHSYASTLRKALHTEHVPGSARLELRRRTYRIRVEDDEVDAVRFERHVRHGHDAAQRECWEEAVRHYDRALGIWRGKVMDRLPTTGFLQTEAVRLEETRLAAEEDRMQALLELRRFATVITESQALTQRYPMRERSWAMRMRALYGDQRQTEALAVYRQAYELLVREAGVGPGPLLRRLHEQILRSDPRLEPKRDPAPVAPSQLPPPLRCLVGRDAALTSLDRALEDVETGAVVAVVTGAGAVGKTALALHWAHRVAERFPDGQLYADLRGYSKVEPVDPMGVLTCFLVALGVRADQVPGKPELAVGLYRTVLSERRVLLVLDNARSAEQVLPLLPSSPGCMTVITSRNRMIGLDVVSDARRVQLAALDRDQAVSLLEDLLGKARVAEEPRAVTELVRSCAGLPLALRVAAAQISCRPGATIIDHLLRPGYENAPRPRAVLGCGDTLYEVFLPSYNRLSATAQRLFELIGTSEPSAITFGRVVELAGISVREAARALDDLFVEHLVEELPNGDLTCHQLLRDFATAVAEQVPSRSAG